MSILWTIIIGFVAGVIARFFHPGNKYEPKGFILTTLLGIVGAFVATYGIGVPEDARKEHFVALGFALLLIGLLVAVDIVLVARTVDQLARSEVYAGTYPASSVR